MMTHPPQNILVNQMGISSVRTLKRQVRTECPCPCHTHVMLPALPVKGTGSGFPETNNNIPRHVRRLFNLTSLLKNSYKYNINISLYMYDSKLV